MKTRNYFYQVSIIILLSCIVSSCSEVDEESLIQEPTSFSANFRNFNGNTLSRGARLLNGAAIQFEVINDLGFSEDLTKFSVNNVSNNKVAIIIDQNNQQLIFTTNELEPQEVSFDAFFNGEKIGDFDVVVDVPYKLTTNGEDIRGPIILDFTQNTTPVEYKLIRIDGSYIEDFELRNLYFTNENTLSLSNYEVFEGDNFKFFIQASEVTGNEFTAALYYRSEQFDFQPVFVKSFQVTTTLITDTNCQITKEKMVIINDVGEAVNRDFNFLIRDSIIQEYSSSSRSIRDKKIFYENGKIKEILDANDGTPEATYTYRNNLLVHSEVFRLSSQIEKYDFYYDSEKNLTSKVYKIYNNFSQTTEVKDSIIYENYNKGLSERRIHYSDFDYTGIIYALYYKTFYDANRNVVREEVSRDDQEYILYIEQEFDPVETTVHHLNLINGKTFIKSPVLLSKSFYTNERGSQTSPSFLELKEIKKDNSDNIIKVVHEYFDNGSSNSYYTQELLFSFDPCN
ncbi:hypothetical protein NBT05_12825 [Aquimarina sp. ERC-38]|uniref:hypothetical protein n=1 Tax=Aquimarina sp. ERC-38 TaxID=2949996 RepID=UPI00224739B1|nr:hypothetical protein [Aquimarina sp. ERC-38]UZO79833.1 hypothetical protein NBT05_12825 [Aquimarina sp. ERC-38]